MEKAAYAAVTQEVSSCCGANVSYGDYGMYCKSCYGDVDWEVT